LNYKLRKLLHRKLKFLSYLTKFRAYTYGVRWLRDAAEAGDSSSFEENMAKEIIAAINFKGKAYKKKQEMCKEITG
jgi:ribosomal protein S7